MGDLHINADKALILVLNVDTDELINKIYKIPYYLIYIKYVINIYIYIYFL